MSAETCFTCRFFGKVASWASSEHDGLCRRHAPIKALVITMDGDTAQDRARGEWPKVNGEDWCGDYERTADEKQT